MSEYLLTEALPEDELEILRVMTHAPLVEDTGVDYIMRLTGSSNQPFRAHVDRIHLFRTFEATEADTAAPAPAARKKEYAAERIMGERNTQPGLEEARHF